MGVGEGVGGTGRKFADALLQASAFCAIFAAGMERPDTLYVIKGELFTNVVGCEESLWHGHPVWKITYKTRDGLLVRSQAKSNVIILPYEKTVEGTFRYEAEDGNVFTASRVHLYGKRSGQMLCAESPSGFLKFGTAENLRLESSLLDMPDVPVFPYLKAVSGISTMKMPDDDSVVSLRYKYDRTQAVFKGNLLYAYCVPGIKSPAIAKPSLMLFPFGSNGSQHQALLNALGNRLSVIEGPPGTGKTQTILNIVMNLVIAGKTCLIVSNNNSAVANVVEKLSSPKYGFGFLVAGLGRMDNKESFVKSQTGAYPEFPGWKRTPGELDTLRERLLNASLQMPSFFDAQEKHAQLRERLAEFDFQKSKSASPVAETANRSGRKRLFAKEYDASDLYSLVFRLDRNYARHARPCLLTRILSWLHGFGFSPDRNEIIESAQALERQSMVSGLDALQKVVEELQPLYQSLQEDSLAYCRALLYERYGNKAERTVFSDDDIYLHSTDFLKEYPIVTSTTFSASTCVHPNVSFDYIIMDESSQVDIASGALALNVARSAVIVGDPKQLPNVVTAADAAVAESLFKDSRLPEAYRYVGNSFLDSVKSVFKAAPCVLLREHYRCEPSIIGFCNRQFYGGSLVIMTRRLEDGPAIKVIRSVSGNHARGHKNQREADEVVKEIRSISGTYSDIGVIAPYKDQVSLIRKELSNARISAVNVDTVHKFQGRENDVILLSAVDNEVKEFVDDPHLLNVAVSRAKKRFVLCITGNELVDSNLQSLVDYIGFYGTEETSKISSVFDILYDKYWEERRRFVLSHPRISEYDSENIMYALLQDIISEQRWNRLSISFQYPLRLLIPSGTDLSAEEQTYKDRSWTLVDFVLFDKVSRKSVLAIEVDGMRYHSHKNPQHARDILKDSILRKSNVHILRIPTNGSGERERIVEKLESILGPTEH